MTMRQFLLPLSLALASGGALAQTTWYVDVNGTAPGTGTAVDPYTSVQYAVTQPMTVSGDTLLVAPGEYLENVDTYAAQKQIHIRSLGGPEVTTIKKGGGYIVVMLGYLSVIDGFTVRGDGALTGTGVGACGATVRNCVLTSNGLGLYACTDCWLEESTITGNHRAMDVSVYDLLRVKNSISWGNTVEQTYFGNMIVSYSLLSIPAPGAGNLHGDPLMWNAAFGDVRLKPGSVCIDAGDPTSPLDPDGSPKDIGAFTFDPTYAFGPMTYCAGKLNSQGCVPSIGFIGSCCATNPAPFFVTATLVVDKKAGLLFYGFGARAQPFQGGLHCIQPPTTRCPAQFSGTNGLPPPGNFCSGNYAFDFKARVQSGAHPSLAPGAVVFAQWWHRDPSDPSGFGTGLTNAISFGIAP